MRHIGWWVAVLIVALVAGCRDKVEAGVLVNVQLDSTLIQVSRLRLRGYPQDDLAGAVDVTRSLPDEGLFDLSENLLLLVPEAWIGRTVWLTAEGLHGGVITSHGRTSVVPEKNGIVDSTLLLIAGPPPCGNGIIDGGEQCDGTNLGGYTCETLTGLGQGTLACVDCQLHSAGCHLCGNGEIEAGPEECDGENLAGETCASQGFVAGELVCGGDCRLDRSACAQGCGNGVIEGTEACDGLDLAHLGCVDLGYLRGPLRCTAECELDDSLCEGGCGDGVLDAGEDCDGSDVGNQTCLTAAGRLDGVLGCTQSCHLDVSACHFCGDGVIEADEQCDGPSLAGETCTSLGFAAGTLACASDCTYDDSLCGPDLCGNGVIDATEQCDGTSLGGETCVTQGFDGGTLACALDCQLDTGACTSVLCGNGVIDATEQCDGTDLGGESCATLGLGNGTLLCTAGCALDTSGCGVVTVGCGNGFVSAAEECDDGNLTDGDGCDATCHMEPGYRCYDDPSTCVADSSVIFVDCGVACSGTGTLTDPFCDIGRAVNSASTGQVIWLLPSPCVEDVIIDSSDADVVISGDPGATWTAAGCLALTVFDRQVLLWRLHIREGIEISGATASLTVRSSELGPGVDSCEAVHCHGGAHCDLERNYIHDNSEGGIWVISASFRIVSNFIVDNGTAGSSFRGGLSLSSGGYSPTTLINNTIAYNRGRNEPFISGVRCVSAMQITNNIIWMNSVPEVSSACDPWYNDISGPDWVGIQGNINALPLFVDQPGGDYHIQPTSPCVDTGDPTGVPPAPPGDIDGEVRPMGNGVDMGADESS